MQCDSCGDKLIRPEMAEAYCCVVCDERLCEMCAEMIAFEPLKRLQMLCRTQRNLNHWCHGARSSTRWHVSASKTEVGHMIPGWTWELLCRQRTPYGDYIFDHADGWRAGSSENARLRQKTVRRTTPPPASETRAWKQGAQIRKR